MTTLIAHGRQGPQVRRRRLMHPAVLALLNSRCSNDSNDDDWILPSSAEGLAGALAATVAKAVVFPLETYRVVASTRGSEEAGKLTFSRLTKGLAYACAESFEYNFMAWGFYLAMKKLWYERIYGKGGVMGPLTSLIVGMATGTIALAVDSPITVVQVKFMSTTGSGNELSPMAAAREIWADDGLQGFWRGYDIAIWKNLDPSIVFYIVNTVKHWYGGGKPVGVTATFFISLLAKFMALCVCYPLSFAQYILQAQKKATANKNGKLQAVPEAATKHYNGLVHVWRDVYAREGFIGLYSGFAASVSAESVKSAIRFALKDLFDDTAKAIVYGMAGQAVPRS